MRAYPCVKKPSVLALKGLIDESSMMTRKKFYPFFCSVVWWFGPVMTQSSFSGAFDEAYTLTQLGNLDCGVHHLAGQMSIHRYQITLSVGHEMWAIIPDRNIQTLILVILLSWYHCWHKLGPPISLAGYKIGNWRTEVGLWRRWCWLLFLPSKGNAKGSGY